MSTPQPSSTTVGWVTRSSPRRIRVLLAEGDVLTARVVRHRLERDGMDIEVVHEGVSALEQVEKERFDVVIVDAALVGIDGLDLVRRIRQGGLSYRSVAISVLCWPGNDVTIARAYALDADVVMMRPLSLVALSASTSRLSRRARASV